MAAWPVITLCYQLHVNNVNNTSVIHYITKYTKQKLVFVILRRKEATKGKISRFCTNQNVQDAEDNVGGFVAAGCSCDRC